MRVEADLFVFKAEDGIRDHCVTGVQTCALPFSSRRRHTRSLCDWSSDVCSSDLSPRWSPDGRWVACDARGKDGRWNVKVVESRGGQSRQLTSGSFTSAVPAWSRDGRWIYFASDRIGRFEIWRVPSEGGAAERITGDGGFAAIESL